MSPFDRLGTDPRPVNSSIAVFAYLASILLGIGVGVVNVAIVGFFPGWLVGYALFNILMYVASGVMFMPSFLPEKIYYWMKYNPALQLADWMRSAYYPSAGLQVDYLYVIMFALTCMVMGLLILKHVISKRAEEPTRRTEPPGADAVGAVPGGILSGWPRAPMRQTVPLQHLWPRPCATARIISVSCFGLRESRPTRPYGPGSDWRGSSGRSRSSRSRSSSWGWTRW